jgi:hypothetical protein
MPMGKDVFYAKAGEKIRNAQVNYALHAVILHGYRTTNIVLAASQRRLKQDILHETKG